MISVQQLALPDNPTWSPQLPSDPDARAILEVLLRGGRWSRADLMREARRPDRTVRAGVERARRDGWPIVSSPDHPGYFISWDTADLDSLERNLAGRALSALKTRSAIRRARRQREA